MQRTRVVMFPVVLLAICLFASQALAIAPNWIPGFPMRAGPMVMLMWTPVPGATAYKVLRQPEGGEFQELGKVPAPPYNDATADGSTTYKYKIVPMIGGADGDGSPVAELKGQKKMEPPTGLSVRPTSEAADLRWKPVAGAAFYNLYRSEQADSGFSLVGSLQEAKYRDEAVEPEKTYYYQVSAVDANSSESTKGKTLKVEIPKAVVEVVRAPEVYVEATLKGEVYGEEDYELKSPTDVEIAPNGEIHVCEANGVQVLNKDGVFVRRYGSDKAAGWTAPLSIGFSNDGKVVYLVFTYEQMIRAFNPASGALLAEFGYEADDAVWPEVNKFKANPNDVAVDGDGNIWVVDGTLYQILVFEPKGYELIARMGRHRKSFKAGEEQTTWDFPQVSMIRFNRQSGMMYVGQKYDAVVKKIDPAVLAGLGPQDREIPVAGVVGGRGVSAENLSGLAGIGFGEGGNLLAFDNMANKVKVFNDADGTYIHTWIGASEEAKAAYKLETNFPFAFDYDVKTGRFYVTSSMLAQVYLYEGPK